jgi:PAS domain S-box-containing protein
VLQANILVVDDEPANAVAIEGTLAPLGQNIVIAHSGEDALRHILIQDFAVILMDVRMSGMDGYETARTIKSRERSAHVPIIFLTALDADPAHELVGYEHGAVDYLFKPFDPQILRSKVAVFVELYLRGETIRRQAGLLREAERAGLEREGELRLRRLTDLMPLCLWVAAPDGRLESCNAAWTEFSGLTTAESGELGDLSHVHAEDRDRGRAAWRRASAHEAAYETELRLRSREGPYRWHLVRVVPERADDGTLRHWIATAMDIDEKKQAEDARALLLAREREARAEAEGANRAKDEFLATLSHELRTPLNAILGWTHILRRDRPDTDTTERAFETLERSTRVLRQLIDDVLEVSGIIAGKLQLELGAVELATVVGAAIDAVQPSVAAKGIVVERVFGEVDPFAGDARRLQQVALNLLTNAIKFSQPDGRIDVRIGRGPGTAVLTVEDAGVGIDADFLPHVFERFRQAEVSTARGYGGLGLGLAIARHIVELHGGEIAAHSAGIGHGARFTVSLPLVALGRLATGSPSPPPVALEGQPLAGIRVLIVDDSEDVRLLVAYILERRGAHCVLVGSTEEAFAELGRFIPDVLIADIALPREDGYGLIRRLLGHPDPSIRKIPVAALTAYATEADQKRLLAAGFLMHLPKPVSQDALVAAVAKLARADDRADLPMPRIV